ncbi:ribulose-phosphate 3-epimerase [Verrucomicrobiota bacterium]
MRVQILPSLLAADPGNLEAAARKAEASGADGLHLDIMDGVFVPNISMGPSVVEMARRCVGIPLSVHLMLIRPHLHVDSFVKAGADSLLIHIEAESDVPETLASIRRHGIRPGIALNPETPAEAIRQLMPLVDEVLCMTVHPGYGGQSFMAEVLPKIRDVRATAVELGRPDLDILVDGGIDATTAPRCAGQGANVFVAGTSLYGADDMASEISRIRTCAAGELAAN